MKKNGKTKKNEKRNRKTEKELNLFFMVNSYFIVLSLIIFPRIHLA